MTNDETKISRKTTRPAHVVRVSDAAQIDGVFTSSIDAVLAHHARVVAAERARLDAAHAQIDAVFASSAD